ncbi:hypothetical protein Acsp05_02260 [Actinokineospora sp. NBRC 105648]|nr:hypothetical protein Acsp05_02260 [Actinokineospora sp. NBRC 105648]
MAALDPTTGHVIRASKTTAVRYERGRPGELVHMDVKKLGRIPDGGGWRAHGRAHTSRNRNTKTGFDHVHSLVDDHSWPAYSEVLPDEQGPTRAGFLTRAIAYSAGHGITRIERLMTDNAWPAHGPCARSAPSTASPRSSSNLTAPGRTAKSNASTAPGKPSGPTGRTTPGNTERTQALAPWTEHYNTQRRRGALGGHPPTSRLTPT